jgi:SEC-C motif
MKLGRNDPCRCGSGKKYKQCCLGRDGASVVDLADRTWRQMREALDGFAAAMLRFIGESYGRDVLKQAWREFTLGASHELVQDDPNAELFFSWLFHRWEPDSQKGNRIVDTSLYGISPTRAYRFQRVSFSQRAGIDGHRRVKLVFVSADAGEILQHDFVRRRLAGLHGCLHLPD